MRRMISEKFQKWIKGLFEVVQHNDDTNTTEVGDNLEVDGDIVVNGADNFKDKDGNQIPMGTTQDEKDAISGNNEVTITITEDDWDEDEEAYVKNVQLNNTYIVIYAPNTLVHDREVKINNPYFKGLNNIDAELFIGFSGLSAVPEERYVVLNIQGSPTNFSIFNGLLSLVSIDV